MTCGRDLLLIYYMKKNSSKTWTVTSIVTLKIYDRNRERLDMSR